MKHPYPNRKRFLWLVLLLIATGIADAQTVTGRHRYRGRQIAPQIAYVSICESRSAYAYHSGMCRGLARCTHGVNKMSIPQARNAGYMPCKICY